MYIVRHARGITSYIITVSTYTTYNTYLDLDYSGRGIELLLALFLGGRSQDLLRLFLGRSELLLLRLVPPGKSNQINSFQAKVPQDKAWHGIRR